jgi:hypothetical protein
MLVYYNAETGEAATGAINHLGEHRFLRRYTDFARGWTQIAATKDRLLYYNAATSEVATAQINAAGDHQFLQRFVSDRAWTHIAATEDYILFYNARTAEAATAVIDEAGVLTIQQRYNDFAQDWTNIAAIQNRLLYYNATTTELATAEIDPAGNHRFVNRYPAGTTTQWTSLTATQNIILLYNVNEGGGASCRIDASGQFIPLQNFPGFSKDWVQIAGTQRHLLYYNSASPVIATGDFLEDGQHRDLFAYSDFSTRWTHITALKVETPTDPETPILNPIVELLRPDDLLNLRVECRNLQVDQGDRANPVLAAIDATQNAYFIVHFPPQTIAEEAVYEPRTEAGNDLENSLNRKNTETPEEADRRTKSGGLTQKIEDLLKQRPARARVGQPSRLVFQLPANSNPRIPYTTEGLLNWTGLELSVAPVAAMPEIPTPEQLANAPGIAPPTELETAIEMPYRLILSPDRNVIWTHALTPKTYAGRTELWHTRLTLRQDRTTVELSRANPAPLRAIWSPDYVASGLIPTPWPVLGKPDEWAGRPVLTAMHARDRHELVILTSAFGGFVTDEPPNYPNDFSPTPIQAEQVMLSALGGWLKSRGNWNPPIQWIPRLIIPRAIPIDPIVNPVIARRVEPRVEDLMQLLDPALREQLVDRIRLRRSGRRGEALNLSEWVHVATQGRDHYVRIVYEGYLYPFGHRAALIKITERKFREVNGVPFAYLAQRMFIVVRKPLKDYTQADPTQEALTPPQDRAMPLKQVRMTTLVTPDIDLPVSLISSGYSFWVNVGGQPFKFHAIGKDGNEHRVDFTASLIFIPNSDAIPGKIDTIRNIYNQSAEKRACRVPGQALTYAKPNDDASDNTTLTTAALYFDTENATIARFIPKLGKAAVHLAPVEQLLGITAPTEIEYYPNYITGDFDGGNEVFAQLVNKLSSKFSAEKGGGIATPDLSITGVTRKLGAIAGDLPKAAANTFDPKDFFKDVADTATLFGKLKLTELLETGGFSNAPSVQFFPETTPASVKLDWRPSVADELSVGFFEFKKGDSSTFVIEGLVEQPTDGSAGRSRFTGQLTDFDLEFFNVVRLSFDAFQFRSETGQKTDVNVQLKGGENALEFLGDLEFVNELKKIIPPGLFGDGPSLELTPQPAIRAGFAIGLPPVAVGVFALKDVALGASLTLPFLNGSPLFDFNVSERQRPFNLTIAFFGGGGFFRMQLDTLAVRVIEAAFEFGASASVNLGVASGGVYIMAGIYFKLENKPDGKKKATLEGYFRMGGNLTVLGFISVSLEFNLSFSYQDPGKATGRATLTIKVKVLMISKSVSITVEKTFGGNAGDPTFAQVWDQAEIWNNYAGAFA